MIDPLRVALLTSAPLPPREGIGFYVLNLAQELQRRGHRPTLLTRGGAYRTERRTIEGVEVVGLPFVPVYPVHVHLHGLAVGRFLRRHHQEFDLVHAHTPLVPVPHVALPLVTTVHTPMRADAAAIPVTSLRGAAIRAQGFVSARLEDALFTQSDAIVAVAQSVALELGAYGLDPTTIPVLGNAVDPAQFTPGNDDATGDTILYVGRLSDRKGLADLVHATAILAKNRAAIRLLLIGDGPMEVALRRLAADLQISDCVEFGGHINSNERDALVERYQRTAVYVQPSHYEGLPTSLLEAMACARPVVATAISGHLDAIIDGRNGLLVGPRHPEALAAAIERILHDPELGLRLGREARQTVLARYSWASLGDAYERTYHDVLAGHGLAIHGNPKAS